MNKPLAWSYTSLADHKNCPRAYYEKRILKSVKDEGGPHLDYGNMVHKAFELYVGSGKPLPDDLAAHDGYLDGLTRRGDERYVEKKVGLNKKLQPCGFFDRDVFWRGVLDYHCVHGCVAEIVDYKTGKRKPDWRQMDIFAIWIFAAYPQVSTISREFYWTKTREIDRDPVHRGDIPKLWAGLAPDLKQYMQSFKEDVWQERPSGLCHGWCPVKHCQHWKPKKERY